MIALGVSDLEEAVKFYDSGPGFPKMDSPPGTAFFTLNGTWPGLYPGDLFAKNANVSPAGTGFSSVALSHNVTSDAAVTRIIEQVLHAGAEL